MKRIIRDKDVGKTISKVRGIVGNDCLIIFKIKPKGSQFYSLLNDYREAEPEEDEEDIGDLSRKYPEIQFNKKIKPDYFG